MADFTFTELTPTSFLERSAQVYAGRTAVVDGDLRLSYAELAERCRALTGVLADLGVGPGDRVAVLAANSHVQLEMHHAVPMRGAVLVPVNTRLSAEEVGYILEHAGAALLVLTEEYAELGTRVARAAGVPVLLAGPAGDYEARLAGAEPAPVPVTDERSLLGINYTSGTTGRPKGVMTHHRGAYLQSLSLLVHGRMDSTSSYLWTLPMFHCNGWCLTWGVTAVGATHVCLRQVDPERIWRLLRTEGVTHFSAAPPVLTMIAGAEGAAGPALEQRVAVQTGGSPPSPTLLGRLDRLGMDVTHLYGLTETFGPIGVNEWQSQWDALDAEEQAALRARQGVANVVAEPLRVADGSGRDVPRDGTTVGEILARGNDVMLGYYHDPEATEAVTLGGWF
ncbi:MAG: AMP-binding protein, partial [Nocardioides sp.]